jgi:hypothetical protein
VAADNSEKKTKKIKKKREEKEMKICNSQTRCES